MYHILEINPLLVYYILEINLISHEYGNNVLISACVLIRFNRYIWPFKIIYGQAHEILVLNMCKK